MDTVRKEYAFPLQSLLSHCSASPNTPPPPKKSYYEPCTQVSSVTVQAVIFCWTALKTVSQSIQSSLTVTWIHYPTWCLTASVWVHSHNAIHIFLSFFFNHKLFWLSFQLETLNAAWRHLAFLHFTEKPTTIKAFTLCCEYLHVQ